VQLSDTTLPKNETYKYTMPTLCQIPGSHVVENPDRYTFLCISKKAVTIKQH